MIIATRSLKMRYRGTETDIPVTIHSPEEARVDWICRYEIGWPEGIAQREAAGIDAIQSLIHALHMIGAEFLSSAPHKAGRLEWLAPGRGYGFPVASNIRELLVGDDRKYF